MKYFSEGILDVAGSGQIGNCDYAHVGEAGSLREGMEEQDGRRSRTDMRSEPGSESGNRSSVSYDQQPHRLCGLCGPITRAGLFV